MLHISTLHWQCPMTGSVQGKVGWSCEQPDQRGFEQPDQSERCLGDPSDPFQHKPFYD